MHLIQGAVVSSYTVELTVRPGENVTLHCDFKPSTGETIVWYRNCSHENQPPRIIGWHELRWSHSSKSYNLLIRNITDSHLGLYYCGTKKPIVIDADKIVTKSIYKYGNVTTRISFGKLTV